MGSFNQNFWLLLPTIQLIILIYLSVISFNLNPISAQYVYSPQLPITRYSPYKSYNLLSPMPKNMQLRRFMWSNNGNSMGDFYKDVTSGAQAMRQIVMGSFVKPPIMQFKNYFQQASPSNHIQYIVRKPKKIVHIKKVIPKKIIKIVTIPTSAPTLQSQPTKPYPTKPYPTKPSEYKYNLDNDKYINPEHDHVFTTSKDSLRMIEEEQERRVEATISALFPINNHGNSNGDYNVVTGTIEEFDDSWKPISNEHIEQPKRSHPVSSLHINVDDYVTLKNPPNKIEKIPYENVYSSVHMKNEKKYEKLPYEVTEVSAEESIQLPQAFKPKKSETIRFNKEKFETNRFTKENVIVSSSSSSSTTTNSNTRNRINNIITSTSSPTTTSEKPNYPDYYLEAFPKDYQVDCATKTPFLWKNTSKKDASIMKKHKKEANKQISSTSSSTKSNTKYKKERQTNIQSVTTEQSVKLKPMRKYSSKVKKFRSTVKPSTTIKYDDSIDIQHEIPKYVTIKDDTYDLQAIPTAFTTRTPDEYVKYVTTTTTTQTPITTTISSKSKSNKFDKDKIKKLRGAKKYGDKEKLYK